MAHRVHPLDQRGEVAAVELLGDDAPGLVVQPGEVVDQADLLVLFVEEGDVAVGMRQRGGADDLDPGVGAVSLDGQAQPPRRLAEQAYPGDVDALRVGHLYRRGTLPRFAVCPRGYLLTHLHSSSVSR